MCKVTRIHLKTDCKSKREKLINFCLKDEKQQFLAIGWSYVYDNKNNINSYDEFYNTVKEDLKKRGKRINHVLNVFKDTVINDLFWTRDLDGNYWICRVKEKSKNELNDDMDIGAVLPVEAYKVGMQIPGQIKASFNRACGGTAQKIKDEKMIEYSKYIFNKYSSTKTYNYEKKEGSILDNLPDFDLEELVIIYLQLKKNYYLLPSSIAKNSTTVKIECEFIGKNSKEKAVVQVKAGDQSIDAKSYKVYADEGYTVYLYATKIENINKISNCIEITRDELLKFYEEYKSILPESITVWENLFE